MKIDKMFFLFLKPIVIFILSIVSVSALAEYYVAYPVYVSSTYVSSSCRVAHHYKYRPSHRIVKHRYHRSRSCVAHYYVWQSCCGATWVQTDCGSCTTPLYSPCQRITSCAYPEFYIPPEYIYRDEDMNWDMRTGDDVYNDIDP